MALQRRIVITLAVGIVAFVSMVFVGTQVSVCLGPLGRTHVQSLADGCAPLYANPGTLVGPALMVVLIVLWFSPRGAERLLAVRGAGAGAAIGVGIYSSVRETLVTGPTSWGDVITVVLPFDPIVAATAAVYAGSVVWLLVVALAGLRRRLGGR